MNVKLVNPDHSPNLLRERAGQILNVNMLCSIATVSEDGTPHINTAFFAVDENLALYFLSDPSSVHAANIARTGRVAVSVFDGRQAWGGAHQGLQVFGKCARAEGAAENIAREIYTRRFMLYDDFVAAGAAAGKPSSFSKYQFYVVRPHLLKMLEELEFGDENLVRAQIALEEPGS